MTSPHTSAPRAGLATRIVAGWLLALVGLGLAGWVGEYVTSEFEVGRIARYGLQALIMSGIVLPGIWYLRTRVDRRPLAGLGILGFRHSLGAFLIGAGLILMPLGVTLLATSLFGWATVTVNPSASALAALAAGWLTTLFFEAVPEELAFRGYIYRNLNGKLPRWSAGVLTTVLFALLPVVLVWIQGRVLGMEVQVGNADRITGGYLIIMLIFGGLMQYLRILTGSVWTGIGFHLHFVYLNRIISSRPTSLIQLSDVTTQGPMQVTLIASVLLVLAALVLSPRFQGRRVGWKQVDPE